MKLKDIVVKKGDILYYKNGQICLVNSTEMQLDINTCNSIIKVLRPVKYETIYEAPKEKMPILNKVEKEYLENLIRPFKDKVKYILLNTVGYDWQTYILIDLGDEDIELPYFTLGTMYKGMEPDREYTLKELGLFEE